MRELTRREKWLMNLLFLVVAIIVVLQYMLFPAMDRAEALKEKKETLQTNWENIEPYMDQKTQLKERIDALQAETTELKSHIPAYVTHAYLDQLHKISQNTGVTLQQVREKRTDEEGERLIIALWMNGSREGILSFIDQLSDIPCVHAITEARFERLEDHYALSIQLYIGLSEEVSEQS